MEESKQFVIGSVSCEGDVPGPTPSKPPPKNLVVIPPDGGWGWVVVFAAFVAFFMTEGVICVFGVFLKDMSRSFGCSKSQVSLVGATTAGCFFFSGPFAAALVNRFGFRRIGMIGSVLACISCVLTSFSSSLYVCLITQGVLGGVGYSMLFVSTLIVVGYYFEKWRPLATGFAVCGASVGGVSLPPILHHVLDSLGWRRTYRIMGATTLICIGTSALYRPLTPIAVTKNDEEEVKNNPIEGEGSSRAESSTVTLFHPCRLPRIVSSETIMNFANESTSQSVKVDFKNSRFTDSHLSTVHEEVVGSVKSRCFCCWCCTRKSHRRKLYVRETYWSRAKRFWGHTKTHMRPMYREDIFYSGSLLALSQYTKSASTKQSNKSRSTLNYHLSVTKVTTQKDLEQDDQCCVLFPDSIKNALFTMLHFRLLKSPSFVLLLVNSIFTSLSYYTPYMFVKDRAIQKGMAEDTAFWLISAIAVANTVGRIGCGVISSLPNVRATWICFALLTTGGVATTMSGQSFDVRFQFLSASVFGLSVASTSCLRPIIIVDILGLQSLSNAVGLIMLFQGAGALCGTAVSGVLKDVTGEYDASFYFAGGCLLFGAVFLAPLGRTSAWEKRRKSAGGCGAE